MDRIPFNNPTIEGNELEYIRAAVKGGHTSAGGAFHERVSRLLRTAHECEDVLLTTSCTSALEMAALLLGIEPGDVVVAPSFTFVSTALAFARQGAQIVFCDIERETLGLDPEHLEELLDGDDDVRAVVPVHYAGVACQIDRIADVVGRFPRAEIVEDNAHGLFGALRGRPLGTFGRFSTLSFHETKNFICGEGGALIVNRGEDVDRAHVLYDKGTNRRAFLMGQVDKYSWQDVGSSFGLSDVLAAYLYAQLEHRDAILRKRRTVFDRYERLLTPYADEFGLRLPRIDSDRQQAYHMFYVLLPDREMRDRALASMNEQNVNSTFHYVPLHTSPGGQRVSARPTDCPVSDEISGRLLRLPFYNGLTDREAERVVETFITSLSE